ncbi:MAG TPA: response regulator [Anaerolineae bacterium]|nr:response regulator [Anaerolineae bacterium]
MSSTILVMDDDLLALESLESYLKQAGYTVVTASSAREAVDQARDNPCDLALLDMKMPEMDGFQVAAMLRQLQPDLRVVIFTGYASLETEARAAQLDFYEYLPKSNWYDLLLPTVERVLAEPERRLPRQRPADLEKAAAQYAGEGKWELAAMALEQAARIAEFTYEWENASALYGQAFDHMRRARGLSVETQRLRELMECAQRIAAEGTADEP